MVENVINYPDKSRIYRLVDKEERLFEKSRLNGTLVCRLAAGATASDYYMDAVVEGLKFSPKYLDRRVIEQVETEIISQVPMFTKAVYEPDYFGPFAVYDDALLPIAQSDQELFQAGTLELFVPQQESILDKWMRQQEEQTSVSYAMQCFMDENSDQVLKDLVLNAGLVLFHDRNSSEISKG